MIVLIRWELWDCTIINTNFSKMVLYLNDSPFGDHAVTHRWRAIGTDYCQLGRLYLHKEPTMLLVRPVADNS